jgi:hypothetical protein
MCGAAAAAGVIQITTRQGSPGAARWHAYVEQGAAEDVHDYPSNYGAWFTNEAGEPTIGCTIDFQAEGLCQVDSLAVHNPLEAADVFRTGHRQAYGLNVSGGGERASNRVEVQSTTGRVTARTSYQLTPSIQANTGVGGEFTRELFAATLASASGLLPGTRSLEGASANFAVDENFTDLRTIAGWIERRIAWQDRVYLNLALRADDGRGGLHAGRLRGPALRGARVLALADRSPAR